MVAMSAHTAHEGKEPPGRLAAPRQWWARRKPRSEAAPYEALQTARHRRIDFGGSRRRISERISSGRLARGIRRYSSSLAVSAIAPKREPEAPSTKLTIQVMALKLRACPDTASLHSSSLTQIRSSFFGHLKPSGGL
uniref:Uncharacterized protein n=1 Tax=Arundo donax TaxID=35708 RepID=A0A0A9AQC1_ARUDO